MLHGGKSRIAWWVKNQSERHENETSYSRNLHHRRRRHVECFPLTAFERVAQDGECGLAAGVDDEMRLQSLQVWRHSLHLELKPSCSACNII